MNKLEIFGGTGITSCLSVRLDNIIDYYNRFGFYPDVVDCSQQFKIYKPNSDKNMNISNIIFKPYKKPNFYTKFNHGYQYSWYNEINIEVLKEIIDDCCQFENVVGDLSYELMKEVGDRTAILYRGNDKIKEIEATPYEVMVQMARESESTRFIIQTDCIDFFRYFKKEFPDSIHFNQSIMVKNDPDFVIAIKQEMFVVEFIASLRAISMAPKLIVNTGNTGLWTVLFRGNTNNVWQYHGQKKIYKKL